MGALGTAGLIIRSLLFILKTYIAVPMSFMLDLRIAVPNFL